MMTKQLELKENAQKEISRLIQSYVRNNLGGALHSLFVDILEQNPITEFDYSWSDFADFLDNVRCFDDTFDELGTINNVVFNACIIYCDTEYIKSISEAAQEDFLDEWDKYCATEEEAERRCGVLEKEILSKLFAYYFRFENPPLKRRE